MKERDEYSVHESGVSALANKRGCNKTWSWACSSFHAPRWANLLAAYTMVRSMARETKDNCKGRGGCCSTISVRLLLLGNTFMYRTSSMCVNRDLHSYSLLCFGLEHELAFWACLSCLAARLTVSGCCLGAVRCCDSSYTVLLQGLWGEKLPGKLRDGTCVETYCTHRGAVRRWCHLKSQKKIGAKWWILSLRSRIKKCYRSSKLRL